MQSGFFTLLKHQFLIKMQNKINLGIIGKNFGYNVIYKSFLKNKKYKIKGFSFKSKKSDKIKIPKNIKIYSSWKKLILDKTINAIVIATPPVLHKSIIKFAFKNNKHIFCEKPFTCSTKEANFICNLIKRKKNISHMVNYEFGEIDAFNFFRKKIMNNIKINKIYLDWFINVKKRPKTNWKENSLQGGGIMFNFVCHAVYYLEQLFGKIISIKSNIFHENKNKTKILKAIVFFNNGLSAKLNIMVGLIKKNKPTHQLKIISDEKIYLLKTKLNSLSDKFELIAINPNLKNKLSKTLFKNLKKESDFRIRPTFKNSIKFSNWILKDKTQSPNFFDAQRVHFIINKMIISSKKKKKIYIN